MLVSMAKKRLLTGLQPSGALHIGNYFGALKPFADEYEQYESFLMVADFHSLTSQRDPKALRDNIAEIVKAYVAAGVDPSKAVIFKQSDILEHTELAWIFECLVTVPFLQQAHAYKDKVAKGLEANAGLFNYPMLMAADILLYDTDIVPVGEDQRQHVEYSREAANKFNTAYGQTFKEPEEKILKGVGIVPGTDGQKMSKSYKNIIPLFGSKDEISKAVMSITAGPGMTREETIELAKSKGEAVIRDAIGPVRNLFSIHRLFKNDSELIDFYIENQSNFKQVKESLTQDIENMIAPMRSKYESISDDEVRKILAGGAAKVRTLAQAKMKDVRAKIGVTL